MAPIKKLLPSTGPGWTRCVSVLQFDGKILNVKCFCTILLIFEYPVWKYFIQLFILYLFLFFSCDQWILPSRRDSSCQTKRSIWTFISSQIYKFSNQLSFKTSTKFYILWRYYYYYHHGGIFALRKFPSLNLLFF